MNPCSEFNEFRCVNKDNKKRICSIRSRYKLVKFRRLCGWHQRFRVRPVKFESESSWRILQLKLQANIRIFRNAKSQRSLFSAIRAEALSDGLERSGQGASFPISQAIEKFKNIENIFGYLIDRLKAALKETFDRFDSQAPFDLLLFGQRRTNWLSISVRSVVFAKCSLFSGTG